MDSRNFFCSELVAKAYKECGLLNTSRACCTYYPGDFSQKAAHEIKLEKDAKIGDELQILFDDKHFEMVNLDTPLSNFTVSVESKV